MNTIYLRPYAKIANKDYADETKFAIRSLDFKDVSFQDGITVSFVNCRFNVLEIENTEMIEFEDISIEFVNCFIGLLI